MKKFLLLIGLLPALNLFAGDSVSVIAGRRLLTNPCLSLALTFGFYIDILRTTWGLKPG